MAASLILPIVLVLRFSFPNDPNLPSSLYRVVAGMLASVAEAVNTIHVNSSIVKSFFTIAKNLLKYCD